MTESKALGRLSDKRLEQRIRLNQALRFGLEEATPAQLNVIFILARRWDLDPVTDLTLYQGVPWVTNEGWYRVIRRHEHFRSIDTRPLSTDEKNAWGYPTDDIVIECAIATDDHGVIKARGRATRVEIDIARERARRSGKQLAPIGTWDVEIAEKRSIARAAKLALGRDVPDEMDVQRAIDDEMAERNDPTLIQERARRYDEIYGEANFDVPPPAPEPGRDRSLDLAWARWRALALEVSNLGLEFAELEPDASRADIEAASARLQELMGDAAGQSAP